MSSKFVISITREDGQAVLLRPGGHGEQELITVLAQKLSASLTKRVTSLLPAQGVGVLRSTAHVVEDVDRVLQPAIESALREALTSTLLELKSDVVPVH